MFTDGRDWQGCYDGEHAIRMAVWWIRNTVACGLPLNDDARRVLETPGVRYHEVSSAL
ncbi:MAG: hypothetical protein NT138_06850 [Planctomycetales bacterium]|nr:hypothetical protein [Planctomycetales bacterium]